MDKCIKIIVVITMFRPSCAGRYGGYGGGGFDRHSYFHHDFEHPNPQRWHPGRATWDSPENWHVAHHHQHAPYHHQFPSDVHHDKEYWQTHHHGNWDRPDWSNSGGNADDRYQPQWSQWIRPPPARTTTTTTASPAALSQQQIQACIRTCPTTPEYNPVCGSNNVTYSNPGRLECARFCGVDVIIQRRATCSAQTTLPPMTPTRLTTQRPAISDLPPITPPRIPNTDAPPTELPPRFPNIDLGIFTDSTTQSSSATEVPTIPPDVLNSIFTKPTESGPDVDVEIDIRTRREYVIDK